MQFKSTARRATEVGVALVAVITLILAGCGGGGGGLPSGGSGASGTTSVTVVPFKGRFLTGNIVLRDASGNVVPLMSGGTINANGIADITFSNTVTYPLVVEVYGVYYNENTGAFEAGTVPLRGLIVSASSVGAASAVPVTIITETAVADLQNRLGSFGSGAIVDAASAVAALQMAGNMLGIPAAAVPNFDPLSNKTSDPDTLRLAALAAVAGSQATGTTLAEKVKALASSLATLNPVSAPSEVVSQAAFDSALVAVTTGASGVMAAGATVPSPTYISTLPNGALYSLTTGNQLIGGTPGGTLALGGGVITLNAGGLTVNTVGNYGLMGGTLTGASGASLNTGGLTASMVGNYGLTGGPLTAASGTSLTTTVGTIAISGGGLALAGTTTNSTAGTTTNSTPVILVGP